MTPENSQCFLLLEVVAVQQPNVDDDLGRLGARLHQETHAQPPLSRAPLGIARGGHGVGKDKELRALPALVLQALFEQPILVFQHRQKPVLTDVTLGGSVDRVAERHVVGAHRLGHGARGATNLEEPARDFLTGTDLRERAVLVAVEIDAKRLLVRVRGLLFHEAQPASGTTLL